ncbi:MAG TPA: hypothetical protein VGH33_12420 [Isosphaeraceae bacterium]
MIDPAERPRSVGFRLHDMAGLVVGYGLASLLIRSFWRDIDPRATLEFGAIGLLYLWAGLAMSGPFILLLDRRNAAPEARVPTTDLPSRFTGEETAWLGIGAYFVAATLFVASARDHEPSWPMNLTIQVIGAAVAVLWLRIDRRERGKTAPEPARWTRRAAALVLITWPVAWIVLLWLVW